jgi:hypothetical protein
MRSADICEEEWGREGESDRERYDIRKEGRARGGENKIT